MTNTELGQTLALLLHVWEVHGQEVCEELMHRTLTEEEMEAVLVHWHGEWRERAACEALLNEVEGAAEEVEDHLLWRECA